ncbi:MAG: phosphatidylglycerophosphatase A [Thermodesulfobacteriota bacterium]
MKNSIIMFLATGAYSGYSPFAPGTVGTLWGIPLAFALSLLPPLWGAAALALAIVGACLLASEAAGIAEKKDPSCIVLDEIVGFGAATFLLPFTAQNVILAFILFRFFDILKPYPAGLIDSRLPGGAGIVLDDVAAGIYANVTAQIAIRFVL